MPGRPALRSASSTSAEVDGRKTCEVRHDSWSNCPDVVSRSSADADSCRFGSRLGDDHVGGLPTATGSGPAIDLRRRGSYGAQMACRITELVLDVRDPDLMARFWCEVLGYVELERDDATVEIGPAGIGFGGPQPTIVLSKTGEPKTGKLRLHFDVNATDREQGDELERLIGMGACAVEIGQTGAESWHVLADPEGNEFCLLRRRVPEA